MPHHRPVHRLSPTAVGLLAGFILDRALGDPRRWHPVAGFGQVAAAVEARSYADDRARGASHTLVLVLGSAAAGAAATRFSRRLGPVAEAGMTAAATWAVLGGRSLEREALAVHRLLIAGDLAGARSRIHSLVGRDPSGLDAAELSRAAIESVAENTSDAVVAPLLWGAVAGVPGLVGYRTLNTLDAMIGHHSPRYERFGWAAARLDDVANWVPARVAALLAICLAPQVAGDCGAAAHAVRHDAHQHPSPNAGQVEAAFAGALGVRLGGTNRYAGRAENRGQLGTGHTPRPLDIARSTRLAQAVGVGSAALAVTVAQLVRARTRHS